jgi:hypothetical protein
MATTEPRAPAAVPAWTGRAAMALLALTLAAAALRLRGLATWSYEASEAAGWLALALPLGADGGVTDGPQRAAPLGWLALHALVEAGWLPMRGEGWMRLPAALGGTIAVPLLALVVRPVAGLGGALLAGAMFALHPAAIASSQALDPAMLAVALALAAVAVARAGHRALGVALAALAVATSTAAFGLLAAAALFAVPAARHRTVAAALGALAGPAALLGLGASMLPLTAMAACGWPVAPRQLRLLVGAVTLGAVVAAQWLPGGEFAAAVAVPGLAALAALGLRELAAALRAGFQPSSSSAALAASLPAVAVFTWLAVDAFLYAAVHDGGRSPWRAVAEAVWEAAAGHDRFVVAAGAGAPSLRVYLRTRDAAASPVVAFDPARGVAALADLQTNSDAAVLLALRDDESRRLTEAARRELAAKFQCVAVVPSPQLHGDDSVAIYRHR